MIKCPEQKQLREERLIWHIINSSPFKVSHRSKYLRKLVGYTISTVRGREKGCPHAACLPVHFLRTQPAFSTARVEMVLPTLGWGGVRVYPYALHFVQPPTDMLVVQTKLRNSSLGLSNRLFWVVSG